MRPYLGLPWTDSHQIWAVDGFSSCSTDTWYPKHWNAEKKFFVMSSLLYSIQRHSVKGSGHQKTYMWFFFFGNTDQHLLLEVKRFSLIKRKITTDLAWFLPCQYWRNDPTHAKLTAIYKYRCESYVHGIDSLILSLKNSLLTGFNWPILGSFTNIWTSSKRIRIGLVGKSIKSLKIWEVNQFTRARNNELTVIWVMSNGSYL